MLALDDWDLVLMLAPLLTLDVGQVVYPIRCCLLTLEVVYVKEAFVLAAYEIVVDGSAEGGYYCFVLDLSKSGDKLILVCDWGC